MEGQMEGRKDGHLEIPICVLQDIGPLCSTGLRPLWGHCPKSWFDCLEPMRQLGADLAGPGAHNRSEIKDLGGLILGLTRLILGLSGLIMCLRELILDLIGLTPSLNRFDF